MYVRRGRLETSDPQWSKADFDAGPIKVYRSPGHARNFLQCVKSRKPCTTEPQIAHRSITPGYLGYVANTLGHAVRWDAKSERIIGDDEADTMLKSLAYRGPWKLKNTAKTVQHYGPRLP